MLAFLGALLKRSRPHTAFIGLLTIFSFVPIEGKIKTDGNYYCGTFNSTETNGASGYFTILISKEEASAYTVQLDLSEFSSTCDYSKGLTYSINTDWNNAQSNSSSFDMCGKEYTGLHYDPTFVCGPDSEYYDTDCVLLGRVESSGYIYNCTEAEYSKANFAICELGDLSGKSGYLYETSTNSSFFETKEQIDNLPPYLYNYKRPEGVFPEWSSIVFSCNDDDSRLVCANLIFDAVGCCNNLQFSDDDAVSDDIIDWETMDGYDIFFVVIGVITLILTITLCIVYCNHQTRQIIKQDEKFSMHGVTRSSRHGERTSLLSPQEE